MNPFWGDLVVRARGLSRRWLLDDRLESVERASDPASVARLVVAAGYPVEEPATAARVEQATRSVAATWWRLLSLWAGSRRAGLLAVLFEEEKVHSLERLVRGAIQAAPPRDRLAGLVPSPGLDARTLRALAEADSVGAMADLLESGRDPYSAPLREQAGAVRVDLWELENGLERIYLERALRRAGRADRAARELAAQVVDHRNLWTALLLSREGGIGADDPHRLFVPGGSRLPFLLFRDALAGSIADPRRELAARFPGTAVAEALETAEDLARLEDAARADRARAQRRRARREPLSSAGVAWPSLALSIEQRRIRRAVWRFEPRAA